MSRNKKLSSKIFEGAKFFNCHTRMFMSELPEDCHFIDGKVWVEFKDDVVESRLIKVLPSAKEKFHAM